MTVQAGETRGRTGGRRRVLAALLALAILIPLGLLFLNHNRYVSDDRSAATRERHGIEYLLALSKLTIALTEAQSAEVSGEPVAREALDGALAGVAAVDGRFGEELRVRERWAQLRDTIQLAVDTEHADGRAAYVSYGEATGLLLGLYDRLRETSGLVRDPDEDANHLQDAASGGLPESIVTAGRLVDLVILTAAGSASAPPADPSEVPIAVAAFSGPVGDLVAGIQATLDSTESRSLSSAVLGTYDRFLRAKDGLLLIVQPDAGEEIDFGQLAFIRAELQAAGDDLFTTLLFELDTLIQTRQSELGRSLWTSVVAVLIGVLLAFGLVAVSLVRAPRQPTPHHRHQDELTAGSGADGFGGGSGSGLGAPQLPRPLTPISDISASYEPRRATSPAGGRFAGELFDPEGADVR